MPSRKQKRRELKSKRHEYEFVYVDDEGNEVEDAPEEPGRPKRERAARASGGSAKKQQQRGGRAGREPQPPSWRRSLRRAALLGIVVFLFFSLSGPKGNARYVNALAFSALYTALFIPFTFAIDRFAYRRWQARQSGTTPAVKKR
jgi:hypothetical protein